MGDCATECVRARESTLAQACLRVGGHRVRARFGEHACALVGACIVMCLRACVHKYARWKHTTIIALRCLIGKHKIQVN